MTTKKLNIKEAVKLQRYVLEYVDECISTMDYRLKDINNVYRATGEKKVRTKTDGSQYEYDEYDYFPKSEDEFTEDDKLRLQAIDAVMKALSELV